MDQQSFKEMIRMLEGFPQKSGDPDLTVSAYELAVAGLSPQAVTEAAQRFNNGLVDGQSVDFAPAPARFAQEARKRQEYIDLKAKPRIPVYRHHTGSPFYIRQEKVRTKYRDCATLAENINLDEYRRRCTAKEFPEGHAWVAALATVYGPPAMEIAQKA